MSERVKVQVGDICWLDPTAAGSIEGSSHWPAEEHAYPFLIVSTSEDNKLCVRDPGAKIRNAPWVTYAKSLGTKYALKQNPATGSAWSNLWFRKDEFLTAAYRANETLDSSEDQTYDLPCPNPPSK